MTTTDADQKLEVAGRSADNRHRRPRCATYVAKVRGGDVGSLPAVLGLIVLLIVFSSLRPDTFTTALNFANLLNQGAGGHRHRDGPRLRPAARRDRPVGRLHRRRRRRRARRRRHEPRLAVVARRVLACLATGAVIGLIIGLLVARLGIPSFVVTLALFLALQGVLLQIIGEGGQISITDSTHPRDHEQQPADLARLGALLVIVVLYGGLTLPRMARAPRDRAARRAPLGVGAQVRRRSWSLLGIAVYLLASSAASTPPSPRINGVPDRRAAARWCCSSALTFLLNRTAFGRHIYAVGGNAEAARRAGINVANIRLACFIMCSTIAAVAGIVIGSRDNVVTPNDRWRQTLLLRRRRRGHRRHQPLRRQGPDRSTRSSAALVVAIIANGMALLNQPAGVVYFVTGLVLLVAASVDALSRRRTASTGR